MAEISEVLLFQVIKKITAQAKISLESLEQSRDSGLKIEKILIHAGFEDKELFKSEENFKLGRKRILDFRGDSERELIELFQKFDIKLKK